MLYVLTARGPEQDSTIRVLGIYTSKREVEDILREYIKYVTSDEIIEIRNVTKNLELKDLKNLKKVEDEEIPEAIQSKDGTFYENIIEYIYHIGKGDDNIAFEYGKRNV